MAEIPEHTRKTLDDFQQQVASKLEEVRSLIETINAMERMYGLEMTTVETLVDFGGEATRPEKSGARLRPLSNINADTYLGLEPFDAAKQYIASVGHAVELSEISEAIARGGAAIPPRSAWTQELAISLGRSPGVVKVGDAAYGLTKFYSQEQIDRLRRARRPTGDRKTRTSAPKRRGRPPKNLNSPTDEQTSNPPERKAPDLKLLESPAKNVAGAES
jgi:hypothetical protein